MKTKTNIKKIIAILERLIRLCKTAGAALFPVTNTITNTVEVPFEVIKEVPVNVTEYVEVPVNVTVEKIVNVTIEDETFKALACDRLLYDDLNECVEEVSAEEAALNLALEFIEDEFEGDIADEMEDALIVDDEDDVSHIKTYNDFEDIEVIESDFDDNEYEFMIKVKYEDTDADEKKYVYVTLSVEDGEVDIESVEE